MLEEVARTIASLGLPGVMFAVALAIAGGMGLAGAAAITAALAMLGGPFGMMGGIAALGAATVIGNVIGSFGLEAVLIATFRELHFTQRQSCQTLFEWIDSLLISREMKCNIFKQIGCCSVEPSSSQNCRCNFN